MSAPANQMYWKEDSVGNSFGDIICQNKINHNMLKIQSNWDVKSENKKICTKAKMIKLVLVYIIYGTHKFWHGEGVTMRDIEISAILCHTFGIII